MSAVPVKNLKERIGDCGLIVAGPQTNPPEDYSEANIVDPSVSRLPFIRTDRQTSTGKFRVRKLGHKFNCVPHFTYNAIEIENIRQAIVSTWFN